MTYPDGMRPKSAAPDLPPRMLRFVAARTMAAEQAEQRGDMELAGKIRLFQFRDARPKAASEMKLEDAQRLLGHSKEQMTKAVYRPIGEKVRPTK